jgi:thiopeptide-type bacteriocin biosynthesis protein
MKMHDTSSFNHSGFFVLRTPLLPFDELRRWSESLEIPQLLSNPRENRDCTRAWDLDVSALRIRLREIVQRADVRLALFVASPSLESSIANWIETPMSKKGIQTERSLVRYLCRMAGRSTPFGLFAGCSVGLIEEGRDLGNIDISLGRSTDYKVKLRVDSEHLFRLTDTLNKVPDISAQSIAEPNSSLHKVGVDWYYLDSRAAESDSAHSLVRIEGDRYLEAVLSWAKESKSFKELSTLLVATFPADCSPDEADEYIADLRQSGVLMSRLAPIVTGDDPLDHICTQLANIPTASALSGKLQLIRARMNDAESEGLAAPPSEYLAISSDVAELSGGKGDTTRTFHVNLIKPLRNNWIKPEITSELLKAAEFLSASSNSVLDEPTKLDSFRNAFVARYQDAWVPLLQALDPEIGIKLDDNNAIASSLLVRQIASETPSEPSIKLSNFHRSLLNLVFECAANGERELVINPSSFKTTANGFALPDSFSLLGTLIGSSTNSTDQADFRIILRSGIGPSGVTLLSRMCYADSELENRVRYHISQEQSLLPDSIYAELAYMPRGRAANVLCRPVLREHEVEYLGFSGTPSAQRISISDLLIAVPDGREIVVYSKTLNKRIIPRSTSAHDFTETRWAPVYRFWCYLQYEFQRTVPEFHWGPLADLPFLPRVRLGKIVLSLASWQLTRVEIEGLTTAESRLAAFMNLQTLRQRRRIPRWVLFTEGDAYVPLDTENALAVDAFLHVLKRNDKVRLQEMYPSYENMIVRGPEGRFCHEVIIPYVRKTPLQPPSLFFRPDRAQTIAISQSMRSFVPGSEWLYVKLYGGPAILEEILTTIVPVILHEVSKVSPLSIDQWFFIRYADPDFHLRVRFKGPPEMLVKYLLPIITDVINGFLHTNQLWRMQLDTYEREIERYGGLSGMDAAESVFYADSNAVLRLLQLDSHDLGEDFRWQVAVISIDRLLQALGWTLFSQRLSIIQAAFQTFQSIVRVNAEIKSRLGETFRAKIKEFDERIDAMRHPDSAGTTMSNVAGILAQRSVDMKNVTRTLSSLNDRNELSKSLESLSISFVHMHVNRLVREDSNLYELVLYQFLARLYTRDIARNGAE